MISIEKHVEFSSHKACRYYYEHKARRLETGDKNCYECRTELGFCVEPVLNARPTLKNAVAVSRWDVRRATRIRPEKQRLVGKFSLIGQ